jgi:hypothetical protein
MSIKQMVGAVSGAVGSSIINGGQSLDMTFQVINGGLKFALNEMNGMNADQEALMELKDSYRTIVKDEAKAAVTSGDKAAIVAAYKQMSEDFDLM